MITNEIKICNIYDFDGTLYFNPINDFSGDIQLKHIVPVRTFGFFSLIDYNILITGRRVSQMYRLKEILKYGNYKFDKMIGFDIGNKFYSYPNKLFMTVYRFWKIHKIITEIISMINENNGYIYRLHIFDDDIAILQNLKSILNIFNSEANYISLWCLYHVQLDSENNGDIICQKSLL